MSAADAVFNQVDLNQDGRVDLGEFRNFVGQNLGAGWDTGASWSAGWGADAGWGASATLGGVYDASYNLGGAYDASYAFGGAYDAGLAGSYTTVTGGAGYIGDAAYYAGGAVVDSGALAVNQVQYSADAQGLYQDPNPQIIRRPNPTGVQTYTQNIRVQFLQPPPVPPPGPLIIKEVRPPQPPVPPPLRLRQVAPPLPPPPPLVLRERPPVPPPVIPSQTIIRRLPGLPVPPRSVIVERVPPPPPRPRDILIERWLPYGPQPKRRTLVQRAPAPAPYPAPRNVIIQYEQAPARVVRQFQRLGVVSANPAAYVQTYGASLLDSASLVSTARAAGVVEDITAPGYVGYGLGAYGQHWNAAAGFAGGELIDAGAWNGWNSHLLAGDLGYGYGLGHGYGYGLGHGYSYGHGYGLGYGGLLGSSAVVSGADAAFLNADTDYNGSLDREEFRNLLAQTL